MNQQFACFTLPFLIGLLFLSTVVSIRFYQWVSGLSQIDKIRIRKNIFSIKTGKALKESFLEGLVHRKIFRKNPVLGYMHMSLAFGWFLLIFVGHLETIVCARSFTFPVYIAVFFRYFFTGEQEFWGSSVFSFLMDFLLLFVLSGVGLAYYKRFNRQFFGIKRTTQLKAGDKIALTALWFVFPLRFFAESISAGIYSNGGFLTQSAGNILEILLPLENLINPSWFAYSLSLGIFFIALPFSRYMHIPTEIGYIFLKNYGIQLKKRCNSYTQMQVFSCSRCGICLDSCQMTHAGIKTQSVYVLKKIRNNNLTDEVLFNCLLCGRCQQDCPVDIQLNDIRISQRIESTLQYNSSYSYLKNGESNSAEVIYFAGCMSHLTPSIPKAMESILNFAGIDYWYMDEKKAPCCGRPLIKAGQVEAAEKLIQSNQQQILASGAKTLVVSCPICYKVFKEDYKLPHVEVKHHSEFLLEMVKTGILPTMKMPERAIYHDPCELGRGSEIYEAPRELLNHFLQLIPIDNEKEKAYCCGGSLANLKIQMNERDLIRNQVLDEYLSYQPDFLVTACPLCKKTFSKGRSENLYDLAEIVEKAIEIRKKQTPLIGINQKIRLSNNPCLIT